MKPVLNFLYAVLLLGLVLTACGPQATPTIAPAADAPPPDTQAPPDSVAEALPVIELVTLELGGPEPGTTMQWVDGSMLVYVASGPFVMGTAGDDHPAHTISLTPFWMYRTKVTNRMYRLCVSVGVCSPPQNQGASNDLLDRYLSDRPVVNVDWEQAQAYCSWVEGGLPTEAQFELAARGPESLIYPWGNGAPTCDLLNFDNCLGKTSRVFDYPDGASPFGVLDMAGNANEWVSDWYDPYYYPNGPDLDPPGPRTGTERVVRSSSYRSTPSDIPSALRFHRDPNIALENLGFRCVVEKPHVFAPFCQTSAFVPGNPDSPPSRDCSVSERELSRECTSTVHEISGGEVRTATGTSPLECGPESAGSDRILCTGLAGSSSVVTAIITCGPIGPGSHLVDPECLLGYTGVPGSELTCEVTSDGASPEAERVPDDELGELRPVDDCPYGMVGKPREDGSGVDCVGEALPVPAGEEPVEDADGCPGGLVPGTAPDGTPVCSATAPDGTTVSCPRGTIPMRSSPGAPASDIVCVGRPTGTGPGACPVGTYLDKGGAICTGPSLSGGSGIPANPCIEGFTYDATLGCCQAPEGGAYPGCSSDEYYDTAHGCTLRREASGAAVTIISFNASTRVCGVPGGGDDDSCGGLDKTSCYATAGCTWDDPGSFCH